jgi:hypothetical protein
MGRFVTPGIPLLTNDPPPRIKETFWSPTSSTLIFGKRDAVLVDVPTTFQRIGESARALFVIDQKGIIRWSLLSPDGVNPGADGILSALEKL